MISLPIWLFVILVVLSTIPVLLILYVAIFSIIGVIVDKKIAKGEFERLERLEKGDE